jgi:hypothetical protein
MPTQDEFGEMLRALIVEAGEKGDVVYQAESFSLRRGDQVLNLCNAFDEFVHHADCRDEVVRAIVRGWLSLHRKPPAAFEDAKPDLLPVVDSRSRWENDPAGQACRLLGDHLAVGLVYDWPEMMSTVAQGQLEQWGVTSDVAYEAAVKNLQDRSEDVSFAPCGKGLYRSDYGDNYDPSRLLLLDIIGRLEVQGAPVAIAPNRETLLVTGADDVEGLLKMAKLATKGLDEPRRRSGIPVRLVSGRWETFRLPKSHPAYNLFRELWLRTWNDEYASQKATLIERMKEENVDLFVAGHLVNRTPSTNELFSCCLWTDGIPSLLPVTDYIVFLSEETTPNVVEWDRVRESFGSMMNQLEVYPPRYGVSEFPDKEQLQAIAVPDDLIPFQRLDPSHGHEESTGSQE